MHENSVVGWLMTPKKDVSVLFPGTYDYYLTWQKGEYHLILQKIWLSEESWEELIVVYPVGPKCNHMNPYKREAEGVLRQGEIQWDHRSKDWSEPRKAGRGKEWILL